MRSQLSKKKRSKEVMIRKFFLSKKIKVSNQKMRMTKKPPMVSRQQ